jgi:cell division protein FtsZ
MTKIKVVGIGGAGGNTISRLFRYKIKGVDLIAINTDLQDLKKIKADYKIVIGNKITKGLGTGMRPEFGEKAAKESKEEIKKIFEDTDLVFITGGLGGGTFSGAGPVISQLSKESGALTIAVVIKPFSFEGAYRKKIAKRALKKLENCVDAFIPISNDRLTKLADSKTTVEYSFLLADKILKEAILGICDLILKPGIVNLDFASIKSVLKDAGKTIIVVAEASGENRAKEAVEKALSSPLLNYSIRKPKGILFNLIARNLNLGEIKEVADAISQNTSSSTKIIFGAREEKKMKPQVLKIMLIASGVS